MLNLTEPYSVFSTTTFEAFALSGTLKANTHFSTTKIYLLVLRACQDIPHHTQRSQRIKHLPLFPGKLQYQSSFYKPKTYKDMEEKTLFTLRTARASTEESSENLDSKGHVVAYRFHSSRKKIVNGKVTEITTMNCSVDTGGASWIQQTDKILGTEEIEVSLGYSENTGSEARTATVTFTQEESGNKVLLHVTQEAGVTYTDVLELPPLRIVTVGSNKGSTDAIEVTSYSLGSDGSKVAKSPNVGNTPSWAKVSIGAGSAEHKYKITFTATETNISTTIRTSPVLITCGTATAIINVSQRGQSIPIKKEFTLTGLPLDRPCYLFASVSRPQSGGGSGTGYLMIQVLGEQVTMSIPVTVNLSSYGDRTTADTGDRVTVWTSSGSTFNQIGSFTVPSAGGTVSI